MGKELWFDSWSEDIHQSEKAQKKIQNAKAAECTPSELIVSECHSIYHRGDTDYNVFLDKCNCRSFGMDRLPCKHMYRLAMELGILDVSFSSYFHGGYTWKEAIDIIEKYPDNVQLEFMQHFSKSSEHKRKKNPAMDILISDGLLLENASSETANYKYVRLIDDFFVNKQKLSWYMGRKYRKILNPYAEEEPLPNDEVTQYLISRGFCLDCSVRE